MRKIVRIIGRGIACATLWLAMGQAAATPISTFGGTFTSDDDIAWIDFTVQDSMLFTARTASFGAGGFAPLLSLFMLDPAQNWIGGAAGSSSNCGMPGAGLPSGGWCWDALFSSTIDAGQYRLVVTQEGNVPNGPSLLDGFSQTGNPHYTGLEYLGDSTAMFVLADQTLRSGAYSVEMNIPAPAPVPIPVPSTVGLVLIGLAIGAGRLGRKTSPIKKLK